MYKRTAEWVKDLENQLKSTNSEHQQGRFAATLLRCVINDLGKMPQGAPVPQAAINDITRYWRAQLSSENSC
ncbi:MAG: hypothetical protein JXK16_10185 [Thiotrichales bacterium]|nr:hypothetical protein [Thiotrichales bacterium]